VIDETEPDGVPERRHNRLDQRHFTRYEIERRLAAAGGFWGEPFDADRPAHGLDRAAGKLGA